MQFHPQIAFEPLALQDAYQSEALKKLIGYLQGYSPFYKRLFAQHAIDFREIRSINDLRLLPTTSKSDMQDHNWDFLCVPDHLIKEYTSTSGTMGSPVTIALTERDLQRLARWERDQLESNLAA